MTTDHLCSVYLPNLPSIAGSDTKTIFKRNKAILNSQIYFSSTSCSTNAKEPSIPNYLTIAQIDFSLPRALVWSVTQTASSSIRTRFTDSISFYNRCYARRSFNHLIDNSFVENIMPKAHEQFPYKNEDNWCSRCFRWICGDKHLNNPKLAVWNIIIKHRDSDSKENKNTSNRKKTF